MLYCNLLYYMHVGRNDHIPGAWEIRGTSLCSLQKMLRTSTTFSEKQNDPLRQAKDDVNIEQRHPRLEAYKLSSHNRRSAGERQLPVPSV